MLLNVSEPKIPPFSSTALTVITISLLPVPVAGWPPTLVPWMYNLSPGAYPVPADLTSMS